MTNVILCTNGARPRLLEQCLRTLYRNTPADQFNLTVICDGIFSFDEDIPDPWDLSNITTLTIDPPCRIIGRLKNLGAYWSEKQFGRGEWLYFSDDDVVFREGWLQHMTGAMYHSEAGRLQSIFGDHRPDDRPLEGLKILGGYQHPFHGTNSKIGFSSWGHINVTDAVAGYSMLMRWDTFDKFGPFEAHAKGVCMSEDFAFSRKVVEAGFQVGYTEVPMIYNCGVTNSEGKPAIGGEHFPRIPGLIYE